MAESSHKKVPEPSVSYEACVLGLGQMKHRIRNLWTTVSSYDPVTLTPGKLKFDNNSYLKIEEELQNWETKMVIAWGTLADEDEAIKKHRPDFDLCRNTLEKIFLAMERSREQEQGTSESSSMPKSSGFKMERIKLKPFSGLFEEWQEFKDLFATAVDGNTSYSGAEKMFYLKTSLTGEALSIVTAFPSTSASYVEAWTLVKKRYDNQREIVFAHIRKLDTLTKSTESTSGLRKIIDTLNECVRSLKIHKVPVSEWDVILTYLVLKKLDEDSKKEWLITQHTSLPVLKDLVDFLETRAMALAEPIKIKPKVTKSVHVAVNSKDHSKDSKDQCPRCGEAHYLHQCQAFKNLNIAERSELIKLKSLCFNCFRYGHSAGKCLSKYSCRHCGRKHHSLVHREEERSAVTPVNNGQPRRGYESQPSTSKAVSHCSASSVHSHHVLLGTILADVTDCCGDPQIVRVFVDNGSESCLISEHCVDRLGLSRKKSCISVTGIPGVDGIFTKGIVPLTLYSRVSNYSLKIEALVLPKITSNVPRVKGQTSFDHIKGLNLSDPFFFEPRPTDIILGAEFASRIKLSGIRHGPTGTPTAEETYFGWILTGSMPTQSLAKQLMSYHLKTLSCHVMCNGNEPCLQMNLQKFWEVELPDFVKSTQEARYQDLEDLFVTTTSRDIEGRYTVHLTFTTDHEPLGESRPNAIYKFLSVEKRIHKDQSLLQSYTSHFEDHLNSGMMEVVPSEELHAPVETTYYMPYHEVIKESSTTTKVRIVYNCSSKTRNGPSLNATLAKGPKLQNDLCPLLLRFRSYAYAFSTDIMKFYNQFKVVTHHTDYQRLVWRKSPREEFKDYRLLRLTFAVTSSPYLAIRAYNQLVDDECQDSSIASRIKQDVLVDNILTGANSLTEASHLQNIIIQVMKK